LTSGVRAWRNRWQRTERARDVTRTRIVTSRARRRRRRRRRLRVTAKCGVGQERVRAGGSIDSSFFFPSHEAADALTAPFVFFLRRTGKAETVPSPVDRVTPLTCRPPYVARQPRTRELPNRKIGRYDDGYPFSPARARARPNGRGQFPTRARGIVRILRETIATSFFYSPPERWRNARVIPTSERFRHVGQHSGRGDASTKGAKGRRILSTPAISDVYVLPFRAKRPKRSLVNTCTYITEARARI